MTQLASFMEDLEASGLLRDSDGAAPADSAAAATANARDAASEPVSVGIDPDPGPEPAALSATSGAAGYAEGPPAQAGDQAGGTGEGDAGVTRANGVDDQGGDAGAAASADGGAAEQRVLGELVGAPGWHEAHAPCRPRPQAC